MLGQGEAFSISQAGQLGVISGIHAQNGEFGAAAPDLGEQLVVALNEHLAALQLADHLTEQPGAEYDAALLSHLCRHHGGNAQLQVVTGQGQGAIFRPDQPPPPGPGERSGWSQPGIHSR